jgi:hypothetical protein
MSGDAHQAAADRLYEQLGGDAMVTRALEIAIRSMRDTVEHPEPFWLRLTVLARADRTVARAARDAISLAYETDQLIRLADFYATPAGAKLAAAAPLLGVAAQVALMRWHQTVLTPALAKLRGTP